MAQILGRIRVSRYKFDRSQDFIIGFKFDGGHWCSVALQTVIGVRNLSSYMKLYCEHMSGVRVVLFKGHFIESTMFKNRDKQMNFIVRVRFSKHFILSQVKFVIVPEK